MSVHIARGSVPESQGCLARYSARLRGVASLLKRVLLSWLISERRLSAVQSFNRAKEDLEKRLNIY